MYYCKGRVTSSLRQGTDYFMHWISEWTFFFFCKATVNIETLCFLFIFFYCIKFIQQRWAVMWLVYSCCWSIRSCTQLFGDFGGVVHNDSCSAVGLCFILEWASFTIRANSSTGVMLFNIAMMYGNEWARVKRIIRGDNIFLPSTTIIPFGAKLINGLTLSKLIVQSSVNSINRDSGQKSSNEDDNGGTHSKVRCWVS